MKLGIVVLYVDDLAKAQTFYTDILGMRAIKEHSGPTFVSLSLGDGSWIGLQDRKTAVMAPRLERQGGSLELSFEVNDVDATWKRWQEKGVELLGEPVDMPFGRYFMAKDPEGYYLSVYRFK